MSSFLDRNLAALSNNACNRAFKEALLAFTPDQEPPFDVSETPDGDFCLWVADAVGEGVSPLHSQNGASSEAKLVVQEAFCLQRHALNCVLGLGLGYVLEAAITHARANQWTGDLFLLEEDIALAHFVFSNVDLTGLLNYEGLRCFTKRREFWGSSEGHYVEKDGVHYLATPNYCQRYDAEVAEIITKHQIYLANARGNANLLGRRGLDWTDAFLKNVHHLPTLYPVDACQNRFKGKTALICGGGPSLDAQLDALKANREKVVIVAIARSARTLLQAGITPDFIVFMDYIGPSKQLHGLDAALFAESHFVTGPSAEPMVFDLPCKSRWLAALHANEQFSYLFDGLYEYELARYSTGGSVSIFAFTIAYNLGFDHLVLLGQDLCLQGNRLYSGDHEPCVLEGDRIISPDSATSFGREEVLLQAMGWDGSPRNTKKDYLHFKGVWERLAELAAIERPELTLSNASVGGLKLEQGWQHASLEEVLVALPEAPASQTASQSVDALVGDALKQWLEVKHPVAVYRSLAQQLDDLTSLVQKALKEAKSALQDLHALLATPFEGWHRPSERYAERFNAFSITMESHPMLVYTFYGEHKGLYDAHDAAAETEAQHKANLKQDDQHLKGLIHHLETVMLRGLQAAKESLVGLNLASLPDASHPLVQLAQGVTAPEAPNTAETERPLPTVIVEGRAARHVSKHALPQLDALDEAGFEAFR